MSQQRLAVIADVSTVTMNQVDIIFDPVPQGLIWTFSITTPTCLATALWTARIGISKDIYQPLGSWYGFGPFGPIQLVSFERLILHGSGLFSNAETIARLSGYSELEQDARLGYPFPLASGLVGGRGVLGRAIVTANQTGIGAVPVALTGFSVTAFVDGTRLLRVEAFTLMGSTNPDERISIRIKEDGVIVAEGTTTPGLGGANPDVLPCVVLRTPAAGSHTWTVEAARVTGAGVVTSYGGAGFPVFLLVEDIGQA